MALRTRIFVDFWNLSLNWRDNGHGKLDWPKTPHALCKKADEVLAPSKLGNLSLEETRVYASYEEGRDEKLRGFLTNFLDKQPGIRVFQSARRWRKKKLHCRVCKHEQEYCEQCNSPLGRAVEKGVDSQIVTDMMALAWEEAYDVALLVSCDKDFIPAVEKLQSKNKKIVNATWKGLGHHLAGVSWASFEIDSIADQIKR